MIGSQSLVSAFTHAVELRSLDVLTLFLLALWILSPLGGQSALRLLHETNSTISQSHPIFYPNVDSPSHIVFMSQHDDVTQFSSAVIATTFSTVGTLDAAPQDPWNHPKIPRIPGIEQAEARNVTNGPWLMVDKDQNISYTSLTGVNIADLQRNKNVNFTIPYEYMYFNCDLLDTGELRTERGARDVLSRIRVVDPWRNDTYISLFNTSLDAPGPGISTYWISTYKFLGYYDDNYVPKSLFFVARNFQEETFLFNCSYNSVLVEASLQCRSDNCEVDRIRRLWKPRTERGIGAGFPWDVVHEGDWNSYFLRSLGTIGGFVSNNRYHPVNSFIYGNEPWRSIGETSLPEVHNWTTVAPADMSKRLTRYLNTYWDASRWKMTVTRNDPFAESPATLNKTTGEPFPDLKMNKTQATLSWQVPVYKRNTGWIACLIICSSVLLFIGTISLVVSFFVKAPDIFNYVSSFTRDNPYIDVPEGGSSLCGSDRARLLKDLRVQLGDVETDKEAGYVALRTVLNEEDRVKGILKSDRRYR
jgi:hypothetical protein